MHSPASCTHPIHVTPEHLFFLLPTMSLHPIDFCVCVQDAVEEPQKVWTHTLVLEAGGCQTMCTCQRRVLELLLDLWALPYLRSPRVAGL